MTKIILVSAPSGAGKSSFVEKICRENERLEDAITYTTRKMRVGEEQGIPYFFVSLEEFEKLIKSCFFVEYAKVHENFYGTPVEQLEKIWKKGKCVIIDIDIQGARTFREKYPEAKTIFILPPSINELRNRVIKRDGKVPADLDLRMANAVKEISHAGEFDYQVVNDNFEVSYAHFKKIVEDLLR